MRFEDLVKLPGPELQRGLARVPDALLVQALQGAELVLRRTVLGGISRRRAEAVRAELPRFSDLSERAVQAARRNVAKKLFGLTEGEQETTSGGSAPARAASPPGKTTAPQTPKNGKGKPSRPRLPNREDYRKFLERLAGRQPAFQQVGQRLRACRGASLVKRFVRKEASR